jgi:hypothetical protein
VSLFERYVGIDYSGAETPTSSLKGLRVYMGDSTRPAEEVLPPTSPRRYWTRRGIAEWLVERLGEGQPTLVGIDHSFSFPLRYFEAHQLELDWPAFLEDFQHHWPTDDDHTYVEFVRNGTRGRGKARSGDPRWRRLTELATGAKSVFHFDVRGSVAKSTHAGLPWLRAIRRQTGGMVHFWPFDGWTLPRGRSAVVEVYPSLWRARFPQDGRTDDQHDAFSAAEWMRRADLTGDLPAFFAPSLTRAERHAARVEGWILGAGRTAGTQARAADSWPLGKRFEAALAYATRVHAGQLRKGTSTPYVSHVLAAASLVLEDGGGEDEAIAALLHDAVADGDGQRELARIRRRFGDRVADIVWACSDTDQTPKPPWKQRKTAYIAHVREAGPEARRVSCADKVHNARSILFDYRTQGEALWSRFSASADETLWYYEELVKAFKETGGGRLVEELERVVREIGRLSGRR